MIDDNMLFCVGPIEVSAVRIRCMSMYVRACMRVCIHMCACMTDSVLCIVPIIEGRQLVIQFISQLIIDLLSLNV